MQEPEPSKISAPTPGERRRQRGPGGHVRLATARPAGPPPTRRQPTVRTPREHGVLEVVGRAVATAARRPRAGPPARCRRRPRSARPGPPRPMQTITGSRSASSDGPVPGHRGLAGALAGADHGQLRAVERHRLVARRLQAQARAPRSAAPGAGPARPAAASRSAAAPARRRGRPPPPPRGASRRSACSGSVSTERPSSRPSAPPAELLLAAAEDHAGEVEPGERVANRRRMVLAVDQRDDRHALSRARSRPTATGPSRTRTCAGRTR